jgi:hypothetical protein
MALKKSRFVWPLMLVVPCALAYEAHPIFSKQTAASDLICRAAFRLLGLCGLEQVSFTTGPLHIRSTISLNRSGRAVVLPRTVLFWEGPITLDESDLTFRRGDLRFRNVGILGDNLLPGESHNSHHPSTVANLSHYRRGSNWPSTSSRNMQSNCQQAR